MITLRQEKMYFSQIVNPEISYGVRSKVEAEDGK